MAIAAAKASATDSEMAAEPAFDGAEVVAGTPPPPLPAVIAGNAWAVAISTSPPASFVLTPTFEVAAATAGLVKEETVHETDGDEDKAQTEVPGLIVRVPVEKEAVKAA